MKDRFRTKPSSDRNQRGLALADRGWFEEALKEFDRAITTDEKSPFPRINRASVLMEQKHYIEALEELLIAAKQAPDEPAVHYHLGYLFSHYGTNIAQDEFNACLNLDPEQLDALIQLGNIHALKGETREAEHLLRSALTDQPDDPLANHELGVLLLEKGDSHQAIRLLTLSWNRNKNEPEGGIDLAIAYIQAGFYEKAQEVLLSVIELHGEQLHAYYNLAAINCDSGKTEEAKNYLKKALSLDSNKVQDWIQNDNMFDKAKTAPQMRELLEIIDKS